MVLQVAVLVVVRHSTSVRLVVVPGKMIPKSAHSSPDPQSAAPQSYVPQAAHVFVKQSKWSYPKLLLSVQFQTMLEVFVMVVEVALVFVKKQSSTEVKVSAMPTL